MKTARTIIALLAAFSATGVGRCDEMQARYFEQLRQRGLFSLAESEAISRLTEENLPLAARTSFCIELSRTLMEHAGFASDSERNELWQRARSAVADLLTRDPSNPRAVQLNGQLGAVFAAEGDWLRAEHELKPFDDGLLTQGRKACSQAIEQLRLVERSLSEPGRDASSRKPGSSLAGHEVRTLLHQIRWLIGLSYRNRAELAAAGSNERITDLNEADQSLRRLVGTADEPIQTRTKLLLAVCARLRNERDRAAELMANLEKAEPKAGDAVQNEIVAERIRLLIAQGRPTDAAELLLKTRGLRQRLSGELWLLQTQVLIALRQVALQKEQQTLADRLTEQINTTVDRCTEQVGGFWARRCRQTWDNAQTAQKYGAELDGLMQQARSDFTGGRIDTALVAYASAEKLATEKGNADLATELGFTHASILLEAKQFEPASVEFLRLTPKFRNPEQAAKSHLLATYCLGRLYDEKKSQPRREAYTSALDEHLRTYAQDVTVNDALYLKAQLEEQRLQVTAALPLYLKVDSRHPRALDAVDGAARCYEIVLKRMREQSLPTEELTTEAVERLSRFLQAQGESSEAWNATHADIALRLASILLTRGQAQTAPESESTTKKPHPPRESELVHSAKAERWLAQVDAFTNRSDPAGATPEIVANLRQRAAPLRILALTGCGKTTEAQRLLSTLSASPAERLAIVDRLTQAAESQGGAPASIGRLQLEAAEKLLPDRDQLTPAEAELLDRCYLKACLSVGQLSKAVEIGRRLSESASQDAQRSQELAEAFASHDDKQSKTLAKQCWRRVETLTKAGSSEWLAARLEVLKCCIALDEQDEARKLLQVTKVLYPNLGNDELKARFAAFEKTLPAAKGR